MVEERYEVHLDPVIVRMELARRDWTRRDLAREIGLSEATVRRALKGQYTTGTAYLIGVALALSATPTQRKAS